MLMVAPVREQRRTALSDADRAKMEDPDLRVRVSVPRSTVPAITHVDYSARVQTVDARAARPLLPADAALPRAHRLPGDRQHQLQHPRRADRLHARRCVSLLHGHRHGLPGARRPRAAERGSGVQPASPISTLTGSSTPVPSTSPLPSLTIGFRRAEMTAFWILTSRRVRRWHWGWPPWSLGAQRAVGMGSRRSVRGPARRCLADLVRAWHQSLEQGRACLRAAPVAAMCCKVCYYLLFGAVSRTGSSLDLELGQTETSRWMPRTATIRASRTAVRCRPTQRASGGWSRGLRELFSSSRGSRQRRGRCA